MRELLEYPWQWMHSGHTHGRQLATSRFGKRFYPNKFRQYTHGYYSNASKPQPSPTGSVAAGE